MSVAAVSPVGAPSSPPAAARPPAASASEAGAGANVSPPALLMSRLQQLAQQDPTRLTAIATQASQTLRTAAASATGETARGLNRLADGFAQAASTGDVSNVHLGSSGRGRLKHHASAVAKSYAGASSSVLLPQGAAAKLEAISLQVDQALGLNPPPLGPWGNE